MLIRFLVLLVAANLAWFFWAHGWRSSTPQTEPERLAQQMHPEAVQVQEAPPPDDGNDASAPQPAVTVTRPAPAPALPEPVPAPVTVVEQPSEAAAAIPPIIVTSPTGEPAAPAPEPRSEPKPEAKPRGVCLQAGAFNERQIEEVRRRAAALPQGSWNVQAVNLPDRWMIYLPLPDELALLARRAELRAQGIDTDRPGAGHGTGLSLGRYSSEERARAGLQQLVAKGVRDARIVAERQSARAWTLRLPSATPELRERAQRTLGDALAGHTLQECSTNN